MVPEHPPQAREPPEPYEQTHAIPAWLAILGVVLALWGVVYLVLYAGSDWGIYGDRRSLAALEPPKTSAAGAAAMDGKALFMTHCSACHQATGLGIPGAFPPLAASGRVTGNPENLAKIVLLGITGKLTVQGSTYSGQMPPFAQLSDAEIAAIGSYERSSFGNAVAPFDAALVAKVRGGLDGRTKPLGGDEELGLP
jgi:mono/diheme cytochrome c family protein